MVLANYGCVVGDTVLLLSCGREWDPAGGLRRVGEMEGREGVLGGEESDLSMSAWSSIISCAMAEELISEEEDRVGEGVRFTRRALFFGVSRESELILRVYVEAFARL